MRTNGTITAGALVLLAALAVGCAPEVGSSRWCEALAQRPKTDWSLGEAADYAKHCLLETTEIGSERWCRRLAGKPKGEWSADEAASYAKHCLLKGSGNDE
jgi:Protein of unknown function (DUF3012)